MIVKNVIYYNALCVITFSDCDFSIQIPIHDDPGFIPGDEIIITDTRIWKIVRNYHCDEDNTINVDLPFPEVYD